MTVRTTLANTSRMARTTLSRATVREFSDDHLMQEVKQGDVHYSESPTNFERFQQVGMTSFPIKQQEEEGGGKGKAGEGFPEGEDWNHDQPKGPAAEALMLYVGGSRSHPVALVDDRRVRPYEMSEGEGAHYAPDGSEQMVLFKENGAYVVSLDGKSVKEPKGNKTRMASLRHVNKKMQTHKIEKQQEQSGSSGGGAGAQATQQAAGSSSAGQQKKEKYKHEGESVNTEVRVIKDRIEFYAPGDKKVGLYDKSAKRWFFDVDGAGSCTLEMLSDKITLKVGGSNIEITGGRIKLTSARIDHN